MSPYLCSTTVLTTFFKSVASGSAGLETFQIFLRFESLPAKLSGNSFEDDFYLLRLHVFLVFPPFKDL